MTPRQEAAIVALGESGFAGEAALIRADPSPERIRIAARTIQRFKPATFGEACRATEAKGAIGQVAAAFEVALDVET